MWWRWKVAQKAVGIPDRSKYVPPPEIQDTRTFQFTRHDHTAERAGFHHDVRLADPRTGLTYNWAAKKWPEPGRGTYAIPQPLHDYSYMKFEGRIPAGEYGAGEVRLGRHEPAEIVSSSPERVEFNLYKGRTPEQFVLRKLDEQRWVLNNVTPFRGGGPWSSLVPSDKPKYREGSTDKINFADPDEVLQAKIDGAHSILALRAGKPMKVFSYRVAKSTPTKLLEHTHKIPGWDKNVVPEELDGTVLRGETYAVDEKGRALKEKDIGGILNTNTLASREKQKSKGHLRTAVFDVVKYQGKDVTKLPYAERLEILKEVVGKIPGLHLPPMAYSPEEKQKLFRKIQKGKEPLTREGVVAWDLKKPKITKIKLRPDYNLYVRGVVPSSHEGWAGGVEYSLTPKGPVVGTMGSGFTHKEREDMLKNPQNYIGRVARAKAHEQFDSGALRVPVFSGWDPQKSEEKLFKESSLYHYAPKDADVLSEGLKTPHVLVRNPERFDFYADRAKQHLGKRNVSPKDVIRYLEESRGTGGSRMLSVLSTPLSAKQQEADHRRKDFVGRSKLYSIDYQGLLKKRLVDKAFIVSGGKQKEVDPAGLEERLAATRPPKLKKRPFAFSDVPHGFLVLKKGVVPPAYLGQEKMYKESAVKKSKGKYHVISKNNRILGVHSSLDAARRQERAIHARRRNKLASLLGI